MNNDGPTPAQLDSPLPSWFAPLPALTRPSPISPPRLHPQTFDLPKTPAAPPRVPPPLPHPPVRDADAVVRLDAFDLLVPQADGDLGPLVVDGLRIGHLPSRAAAAREIPRLALLPNRQFDDVDLALRAKFLDFHSTCATNAPVSLKHFRGPAERETMEGERRAHRAQAKVVPLLSPTPAKFFAPSQ